MRNLALLAAFGVVLLGAAPPPPVQELVLGQARCRSNTALCLGDKNTKTVIGGNVSVSSPDGGFSVSETGAVTAPSVTTTGAVGVAGITTLTAADAGQVRVQGTLVPISSEQDGGTGQMRFLSGYGVLSSNDLAVTFNPAFGAIPDCVCASVNSTAAACGVKAIGTASAITFRGANASDQIYWMCHGAK